MDGFYLDAPPKAFYISNTRPDNLTFMSAKRAGKKVAAQRDSNMKGRVDD